MTIGQNIRKLRGTRSQVAVCCRVKPIRMDQPNWARLEADRGNPTEATLRRVAEALGCTFADLFEGV